MNDIRELLPEGTVVFDSPEYDEAIIGVSHDGRAVYDVYKMIEVLVKRDGMEDAEALEFIEYNAIRAIPYIERGPVVVYPHD